ncbi:MAG: response regulator [Thermodesulfobacteriota bacterium]
MARLDMHGRRDKPVLIVDDSEEVREIFSLLLESEGYPTLCAADGRTALDLLHEGVRPCVILLDWTMPDMDGAELQRQLREDPATAAIPVVIVTASPPVQWDGGDGGDGADPAPLLVKPVDASELLQVVGEQQVRSLHR